MSQQPLIIPKQPVLKPAQDFFQLRREGIGFIEQMGSRFWTDYNLHDSGITLHESLCYALTDVAYRIGWDIKDILTTEPPTTPPDPSRQLYPDQAFFTAREILTINPCTPDDFRRLLIDLDQIRNAWISSKKCACDLHYYAWCEKDQLTLSYQKPTDPLLQPVQVDPTGLYEVLLELEADPELGDLNDRKIEYAYAIFDDDGERHPVKLELRFPNWELQQWDEWDVLLKNKAVFADETNPPTFKLLKFNRSKTDSTSFDQTPAGNKLLQNNWRSLFYASYEIEPVAGGKTITIENVSVRIYSDTFVKNQATVADLMNQLGNSTPTGAIWRYCRKLLNVAESVKAAKRALQCFRNLDEDFCRVKGVEVEDVSVCADVEVRPDADIERIQAEIWFQIDQYMNPPVLFYSLKELMDNGEAVEDIFNGPKLKNGFIKSDDLAAAQLKTVLRTSDIINRLMDIEGVVAVNDLMLAKYDSEGNVVKGAADPTQVGTSLNFDANKSSARWQLFMSSQHQPRLYFNQSNFLFYKNGLPFQPRLDEASDTLTQLRGEAEQPKFNISTTDDSVGEDLLPPAGTYRRLDDYFPVQYTLPVTYGIGPEGLPARSTPLRKAQAKQLKAYLMVFEQLLGNAFAQVTNTASLFSLNPASNQTYFSRLFGEDDIQGWDELVNTDPATGLTAATLQSMVETVPEFEERRNRFLDHLMARFGEQFGDYAFLLTNLQGEQVAQEHLIGDKISFLKAYPTISHDRGRAFNQQKNLTDPANVPGLKRRISLLLGYPDLTFSWAFSGPAEGPFIIDHYQLKDKNNTVWLEGPLAVNEALKEEATRKAWQQFRDILKRMIQPDAYQRTAESGQFRLTVTADNGDLLGQYPNLFTTEAEVQPIETELVNWSSNERAILAEHLLLRPKFPGDALYPACAEGDCGTCGDEDPYSFRLTFVMPGWIEPFSENMEMRRFANTTIQQETPSHLLPKICWIGNDGFIENPCDPVITKLADLLETTGKTAGGTRPSEQEACTCAQAIYAAFSKVFHAWYADKTLLFFHADSLKTALTTVFTTNLKAADIACTTVLEDALWADVLGMMVTYFQQIALSGWQFERFENVWQAWLGANAAIDWTEQHLQENVEAILTSNVVGSGASLSRDQQAKLCQRATAILSNYGMDFYAWMAGNIRSGLAFSELDFSTFAPRALQLGTDFTFTANTVTALSALLSERYASYMEVSYRLWMVVDLLSKLRNTYPGATLHDCDDGSDQNPVRLGSTALGNYPIKKS
ncbi:hypothetical protein GO755_25880 [Spirosoma sp. HMF4905]|uniref:Uncharacterized protein n=1 Tax=Spirosoma arboris TaxID=2682092 RepID=A0A7K1SI95_9BACT|nr:hypothetical protein [Spirosoma arboris]MVM33493.1 hypothetical protein [Spirosoma arboris]